MASCTRAIPQDYSTNPVLILWNSQAQATSPPVRQTLFLHCKSVTSNTDLRKGDYKSPPPLPAQQRAAPPIVRVGQKVMGCVKYCSETEVWVVIAALAALRRP
jgi:hypothetical protein